jgi:hypothetical protein
MAGHTPNKASNPDIIRMRQAEKPGATVFTQQQIGVDMLSAMTAAASASEINKRLELSDFMMNRLALAGVGSAYYHLRAPHSKYEEPVQARSIYLPRFYDEVTDTVISQKRAFQQAHELWVPISRVACEAITEHQNDGIRFGTHAALGKQIAKASFAVWNIDLTRQHDGSPSLSEYETQHAVKRHTNKIYGACNDLGYLQGELPTLAGLADPDSAIAVSLRTSTQAGSEEKEALKNLWDSTYQLQKDLARNAA